jgi:glucose-6-phosphate 1-dehydrogenase
MVLYWYLTSVQSQPAPLPSFDFVLFGGTGDLALRKLLPALFRLFAAGHFGDDSRLYSAAFDPLSLCAYRDRVQEALRHALPAHDQAELRHFLNRVEYIALDAAGDEGWDALAAALPATPRLRVFYFATGPELFAGLCERLARFGLATPDSRLVLEKPIGHDRRSAAALHAAVARVFDESRIYRIDHYLGKETVQNLLALRFGNALFEPLWNSSHIERVHITVTETLGVGRRGAYYDASGALRDMVQNHLLQLLCMVAMEPPASLQPEAVRQEKLKVLHALRPMDRESVARRSCRGQYCAGTTAEGPVPGYLEDIGRDASGTETFVALRAELDNWRWAGVPFHLVTGKRLDRQRAEIAVCFRPIPHSIFAGDRLLPNRLLLRLQPDEGIKLLLMNKYPNGDELKLEPVSLDMNFAEAFGVRQLDPYQRLLQEVLRGRLTLFTHRDEIDAAWAWIDPILAAWRESGEAPLPYAADSRGPAGVEAFLPDALLEQQAGVELSAVSPINPGAVAAAPWSPAPPAPG